MAHGVTFDTVTDEAAGPRTVDAAAWKALMGSALGYARYEAGRYVHIEE